VPGEGFPRGFPGGDGHGRDGAELEAHDGAVGARQPCERVVEVASQVQRVADDQERPRARRQPRGGASTYGG
jgi:hypothetical protein